MKVLDINYIGTLNKKDDDVLNYLLRSSVMNDYLLDNAWFVVTLKPDSATDFLYRRMFETVYLRMKDKHSIYDTKTGLMKMCMSLSEVIQYIYKATPPILQGSIKEALMTIDSITDVMKQFLMGDNGGHEGMYLSMFKNLTRLEMFETVWDYSTIRLDQMQNTCDKYFTGERTSTVQAYNITGVVVGASDSLFNMMNTDCSKDDTTVSLQMMFSCKTTANVISLIELMDTFNVLNIKHTENGILVMIYKSEHHIDQKFVEYLQAMDRIIRQAIWVDSLEKSNV